ncbi:MAG: heme exporter protein CcmB [Thermoplasmata archaeon]|nr:MAG: heme exporter protein CcmB [Thermoplasmata archaeon]
MRESLIIAKKDLHTEFRTKQMINSMLIFAIIVVVIFNFAFSELLQDQSNATNNADGLVNYLAPGILWIAFIFTGMLGLSRSFISEKDRNCLEGIMLCPMSRNAIYLGKVISNLVLMFIVEIVTLFVFAIFFNYNLFDKILLLLPVFILGTFGFIIVGSLLSAISMSARNREVLLPLLLFPILIPVIISAVVATGIILQDGSFSEILDNLRLLGAYDIIFFVIGLLTFEYVVED